MAEQILQIENVDPKDLHGPNDRYLDKVKALFPKLKIIARGDFVKVIGDEDEMEYFINRYEMLTMQLERKGKIDERDIEAIMMANSDVELQQKMSESDVLVFGRGGMPVRAITANQKRMVAASEHKDLVFAIGPAGTGKTYTAVALAVRALKARQVRRIILTRPAVEAEANFGDDVTEVIFGSRLRLDGVFDATVTVNAENIDATARELEAWCTDRGWDPLLTTRIQLVFEEKLMNLHDHGFDYPKRLREAVCVRLRERDRGGHREAELAVWDCGTPDPSLRVAAGSSDVAFDLANQAWSGRGRGRLMVREMCTGIERNRYGQQPVHCGYTIE